MVSFNTTYFATNNLNFYVGFDYIKNKSNLKEGDIVDKNFDQTIIGLGLFWEII